MVQLMASWHSGTIEDFVEEEYGSLAKRPCLAAPIDQLSSGYCTSAVSPSQYNPLDEPLPLGLKLRKSPSLLDLIQMKLSHGSSESSSGKPTEIADKKNVKGSVSSSANDRMKASSFNATLLRIGSWEYKSTYEGDLVSKCYHAKHKLVFEVLMGGLKKKLEIQWSDITALKAECPDNGPGSLTVVLARRPAFFEETNPQPRKHTLWQPAADFTDGQASINKKHFAQFLPGVLNKPFEKLIRCDTRLNLLSQQLEIVVDPPYFESKTSASEKSEESEGDGSSQLQPAASGPPSAFQNVASPACAQSFSSTCEQTPLAVQSVSKDAAPLSSGLLVMDTQTIEGNQMSNEHDSGQHNFRESVKAPGLRPSMSMDDFKKHIGNCFSDDQSKDFIENISQLLLNDTQCVNPLGLDETCLMKKVNSLCCLIQDPAMAPSAQVDGENCYEVAVSGTNVYFDLGNDSMHENPSNMMQAPEGNFRDSSGGKLAPAMPRRDSIGDVLNYLPRITSLPKFSKLFGIGEDYEY
ncbi:hypothetical protein ACS0TY_024358 [Phlomoides rotata]